MKALFIGGTGTISLAITRQLACNPDWELWLLNRGQRKENYPDHVHTIQADIHDEEAVRSKLDGMHFDVVADFIAFLPEHVERDMRLFAGKTGQYIFISSASAYQKPPSSWLITESTPLYNPYWQYSRDKIACEETLVARYRQDGFPITIVRPSHTYGDNSLPVAIHGSNGVWQVIDRMRQGKPVIVHGDGTSLWTVTHNTDFAKGFIGLMGNRHAIGEAVHITSDEALPWDHIIHIIAGHLGVNANICHIATDYLVAADPAMEGPLTGDKSHSVVFDNTKLKRLVPGFCATTRFDQGAGRSLRHILETPALQIPDPDFDRWCDEIIEKYRA